jgi:hypothetical protein
VFASGGLRVVSMTKQVKITRSQNGDDHELFVTIELSDETGWPELPSEVTAILREYSEADVLPDAHEINASDGYHYRLLF